MYTSRITLNAKHVISIVMLNLQLCSVLYIDCGKRLRLRRVEIVGAHSCIAPGKAASEPHLVQSNPFNVSFNFLKLNKMEF